MDIYLIRHSRVAVPPGICYGQSEVTLADSYEQEREALKERLADVLTQKPLVFSSPSQRCMRLAQDLSDQVQADELLRELHFGAWEMQPWDAIPVDQLMPWMEDFVELRPPDGENFRDLSGRAAGFLEKIRDINSKKNLVIITHAGFIRALLCQVLEIPLSNAFQIEVGYLAMTRLAYRNGLFSLPDHTHNHP
jgi:alpha-ribazole phosphatase